LSNKIFFHPSLYVWFSLCCRKISFVKLTVYDIILIIIY
jgi:hypothetical protein